MYQALYRKYRPRSFDEVSGQEHVTDTLRRQIVSGRRSHAYLFVGTRGTGKTTCAKILSRAINCLNPVDGNPCNKCVSCVGIDNGSILDVLELDAASNNGVDDVRALRDEAIYSPAVAYMRVYIIDEVHMLSNAAFNALLKILEEPPEHLVFILATTALHKVPATILSRCQRFSFKRLSPETIAARLRVVSEKEGFTLTDGAAEKLARLADGSMRDALSLLDQCASDTSIDIQRVNDTLGLAGRGETLELASAAASSDTPAALRIFDDIYNDGRDIPSLLGELASLMRGSLVRKLSKDSPLPNDGFDGAEIDSFSANLSPERLFSLLETIHDAATALSRGVNAKLAAEMCLIRMCDERLSDTPAAMLARIERLERLQSSGGAVQASDSVGLAQAGVPPAQPVAAAVSGGSNEAEMTPPCDNNTPPSLSEPEKPIAAAAGQPVPAEDPVSGKPSGAPVEHSDGDFWQDILTVLGKNSPTHKLLGDGSRITAELREGALIVRARDTFTRDLIKSDKNIFGLLTDAARRVLGENTQITIEAGGGGPTADKSDDKKRKLDELAGNFSIIKFEQE